MSVYSNSSWYRYYNYYGALNLVQLSLKQFVAIICGYGGGGGSSSFFGFFPSHLSIIIIMHRVYKLIRTQFLYIFCHIIRIQFLPHPLLKASKSCPNIYIQILKSKKTSTNLMKRDLSKYHHHGTLYCNISLNISTKFA